MHTYKRELQYGILRYTTQLKTAVQVGNSTMRRIILLHNSCSDNRFSCFILNNACHIDALYLRNRGQWSGVSFVFCCGADEHLAVVDRISVAGLQQHLVEYFVDRLIFHINTDLFL